MKLKVSPQHGKSHLDPNHRIGWEAITSAEGADYPTIYCNGQHKAAREELAALIVHRVNTYDALVEALEGLLGVGRFGNQHVVDRANEALKLARGE